MAKKSHTKSSNPIHFNKWSNTSYAIFNSIGKVVHIGFLSTIINGITTVKSSIVVLLLDLYERILLEETVIEDVLDSELEYQLAENIRRSFSSNYFIKAEIALSSFINFKITQRPKKGLFSFVATSNRKVLMMSN